MKNVIDVIIAQKLARVKIGWQRKLLYTLSVVYGFDPKRLTIFIITIAVLTIALFILIFSRKAIGPKEQVLTTEERFPRPIDVTKPGRVSDDATLLGGVHEVAKKETRTPADELGQALPEPLRESAEPLLKVIRPVLELPARIKQADSTEQKPPMAPRKTLTEKEVFDQIWPPSYIEALKSVEKTLKDTGFLDSNKRISFASDGDIYKFLKLQVDFAEKNTWISKEEAGRFRDAITNILPQIIASERAALFRGQNSINTVPGYQQFTNVPASPQNRLNDLLDGLKYVFSLAQPAEAAWIRGVVCYKDDAPLNPAPGFNGATFCCNCGKRCRPRCVFVPDCGTFGAGCDIHFGCLNNVCRFWPNAIWNPATGICGCG